jgi:glyoxylate utilization-related uncharacterized protein
MARKVRVIRPADAMIKQSSDGVHTSRRLIRREHGSDRVSLNTLTILDGFADEAPVAFEGYDQIIYVLGGESETEFDGETHRLTPGSALFIPDGASYKYKVIKGPHEIIAIFGPARF